MLKGWQRTEIKRALGAKRMKDGSYQITFTHKSECDDSIFTEPNELLAQVRRSSKAAQIRKWAEVNQILLAKTKGDWLKNKNVTEIKNG